MPGHTRTRALRIALLVIAGLAATGFARERWLWAKVAEPGPGAYPYHGSRFNLLLADSREFTGAGKPHGFYRWMSQAYRASGARLPGHENLGFDQLLRSRRQALQTIRSPAAKAQAEIALAAWLHRLVKATIPRFSLERGYEFSNVIAFGERQCLLQSAVIAALLQEMGADAGVVMVYRSAQGQESNNGHAAVLLKLPDGTDTIVDASDAQPFAPHQGLFLRAPDYRFVRPVYRHGADRIIGYQPESGSETWPAARVKPLDFAFVRSQFWYYRGERANGGILAQKPTPQGLALSARLLQRSVEICPRNTLAVYMLGRAYLVQGNIERGRHLLEQAYRLYVQFGWVPEGPKDYLALAERAHQQRAQGHRQ